MHSGRTMRHFPLKGGLLSRNGKEQKMLKYISKTIPVETDNQAVTWLKRGWKSQDIIFVQVIRCVEGSFVGGGGESERFTRSDGTTSAREWKPCRVGNRHPSVGGWEVEVKCQQALVRILL